MKSALGRIFVFFLILMSFSLAAKSQTISVSGKFNKNAAKRGEIVTGVVILDIPTELHINSNKPKSEFLQPTTLRLSATNLTNFRILYPKGKERKFGFSENTLNVYDHKTTIRFSVYLPKNFRSKNLRVKAIVNYQACTDEVCYPPQRKEIFLQTRIR